MGGSADPGQLTCIYTYSNIYNKLERSKQKQHSLTLHTILLVLFYFSLWVYSLLKYF